MKALRIVLILILTSSVSSVLAQEADTLQLANTQWSLNYSMTMDSLTAAGSTNFQNLPSEFQLKMQEEMVTYQFTFGVNGDYLFGVNEMALTGTWTLVDNLLTTEVSGSAQIFSVTRPSYGHMVLTIDGANDQSIFHQWFLTKN